MSPLEDAARAYVAARHHARTVTNTAFVASVESQVRVDWAYHQLTLAAGFPCDCDTDTCPQPAEVTL